MSQSYAAAFYRTMPTTIRTKAFAVGLFSVLFLFTALNVSQNSVGRGQT